MPNKISLNHHQSKIKEIQTLLAPLEAQGMPKLRVTLSGLAVNLLYLEQHERLNMQAFIDSMHQRVKTVPCEITVEPENPQAPLSLPQIFAIACCIADTYDLPRPYEWKGFYQFTLYGAFNSYQLNIERSQTKPLWSGDIKAEVGGNIIVSQTATFNNPSQEELLKSRLIVIPNLQMNLRYYRESVSVDNLKYHCPILSELARGLHYSVEPLRYGFTLTEDLAVTWANFIQNSPQHYQRIKDYILWKQTNILSSQEFDKFAQDVIKICQAVLARNEKKKEEERERVKQKITEQVVEQLRELIPTEAETKPQTEKVMPTEEKQPTDVEVKDQLRAQLMEIINQCKINEARAAAEEKNRKREEEQAPIDEQLQAQEEELRKARVRAFFALFENPSTQPAVEPVSQTQVEDKNVNTQNANTNPTTVDEKSIDNFLESTARAEEAKLENASIQYDNKAAEVHALAREIADLGIEQPDTKEEVGESSLINTSSLTKLDRQGEKLKKILADAKGKKKDSAKPITAVLASIDMKDNTAANRALDIFCGKFVTLFNEYKKNVPVGKEREFLKILFFRFARLSFQVCKLK